ncbi:hypothetical protein T12_8451 [Trichinella patagoniensis]|uniref:Uncharacterized protein n=1 Tax=Trichinella patagoniensis TaxID=990121 RepID=A0A0V0XWT5_9BILA|nr:hypothetical protein T12_8451 [Trichinella patagoniensis]
MSDIARVALKSVLRALNKLVKNELEHNTKYEDALPNSTNENY